MPRPSVLPAVGRRSNMSVQKQTYVAVSAVASPRTSGNGWSSSCRPVVWVHAPLAGSCRGQLLPGPRVAAGRRPLRALPFLGC